MAPTNLSFKCIPFVPQKTSGSGGGGAPLVSCSNTCLPGHIPYSSPCPRAGERAGLGGGGYNLLRMRWQPLPAGPQVPPTALGPPGPPLPLPTAFPTASSRFAFALETTHLGLPLVPLPPCTPSAQGWARHKALGPETTPASEWHATAPHPRLPLAAGGHHLPPSPPPHAWLTSAEPQGHNLWQYIAMSHSTTERKSRFGRENRKLVDSHG